MYDVDMRGYYWDDQMIIAVVSPWICFKTHSISWYLAEELCKSCNTSISRTAKLYCDLQCVTPWGGSNCQHRIVHMGCVMSP